MVFSSPIFLFLFLPLCLFTYLIVNIFGNIKAENICLLIFSIIFYAYGSMDFLPILFISICVNYLFSKIIDVNRNKMIRNIVFIVTIIINVGMLFIFKYLNFFSGIVLGAEHATNIKLPIGISFYTFQVISYICDVYRKDVKSCRNLIDFALFTMLFPQLIAGPIVRYSSIERELKSRRSNFNDFSDGIARFMIGFSKKIIFANTLGAVADKAFIYLPYHSMGPYLSILTLLSYSMQIYLDFWAYSDMAIGIGKVFGFQFPENFDTPFISSSVTEFWKRWHMTLTTFFKDYVYIPLGGNRKGTMRTYINLIIIFALSGFWHGASFNFLVWGLYNAFFLVIERVLTKKIKLKIPKTIGILYVFVVWNIGMLIFKLDNIQDFLLFFKGAVSINAYNFNTRSILNDVFNPFFIVCFIISLLYLTQFFDKIRDALKRTSFGFIIVDIVIVVLFIYAVTEMLTTGFNPFIYFRF